MILSPMKTSRAAFFVAVLAAPMWCSLMAQADLYELELHLHASGGIESDMFDTNGQPVGEAAAGGALLPVVSAAKSTRPAGAEWNFTGTTSGSSLWVLPKTSQPGVLFLGLGTEEISSSDVDGPITLTFQSMNGPSGGVFSMWDFGTFGNMMPLVTSASGFNLSNTLTVAANDHTHFNYGFTTPGIYDVTFEATATLAEALGGGQVAGTGTFRFGVFDTGSPYPEPDPMQGPYVFFGNTFDNYIYGNGHVDLGVALAPVPEPSSVALAGLGVAGIAGAALRRRMRKR
jgi:surface-anchored protein